MAESAGKIVAMFLNEYYNSDKIYEKMFQTKVLPMILKEFQNGGRVSIDFSKILKLLKIFLINNYLFTIKHFY